MRKSHFDFLFKKCNQPGFGGVVDNQNLLLWKEEQGDSQISDCHRNVHGAEKGKVDKGKQHRKNDGTDAENETGHQRTEQVGPLRQRLSTVTIGSQCFELKAKVNTVESIVTEKTPGDAMNQLVDKDAENKRREKKSGEVERGCVSEKESPAEQIKENGNCNYRNKKKWRSN